MKLRVKDKQTHHCQQRTSERGITSEMITFTLEHGKIQGDKYVVSKKFLQQHIKKLKIRGKRLQSLYSKFKRFAIVELIKRKRSQLQAEFRVTTKLLDKGGIVVVYDNNLVITSYDVDSYFRY